MGEVHHLSDQRREIIPDGDGSALRATWHMEAGYVVISLWRGDTCVATSQLPPREAGRLATFITGGLADLAHSEMSATSRTTPIIEWIRWRRRFGKAESWRVSVGLWLEHVGRTLRTFQ